MIKDRILIVDDEADIALILKLKLEDGGYETLRARDGVEALEILERESFDLMLLDIKMPRMDGIKVLERVRQSGKDLTIIMMTAHGSEDIAVEAMIKGAVDYIAKPFSTEDIMKKVDRALQFNRTKRENLRLQKEIEEERQKMEAIIQGMADLLVAVDISGNVLTVNQAAEKVLQIEREQVKGVPVEQVVKGDAGLKQLPCHMVLEKKAPVLDVAYTLMAPDKKIPVLSSATPLFGASGDLLGSVEIIRDISALKALEQEREDFVSMLSHDLKSPLTAIVGSIDLVREGRLGKISPEQKEYLDAAVESSTEAVEMINTLLDVHKFEAGKMTMSPKPEDIQLNVQRRLAGLRPIAKREQLNLYASFSETLPQVRVDRNAFARLLGNLISNAIKFTPEGGEIEVKADTVEMATVRERIPAPLYAGKVLQEGRYLRLTVRDTGSGIPRDDLVSIFDRFAQARNRRMGKIAGTGLGLTYCRKVMDAHGGVIWAESAVGKGSTFFLLFPLEPLQPGKESP